ncbi:hypothetical protein PGT21_035694 [Puccinia graminis f. sp. tritici]|uniref:Uncharacterized protein n=1 Tax=Puccinia graminis f. sp. tritici TaxID=56615 RepID=A0A5B0R3M5_PUCGR|nr:hypothetical protein PGT21_035694 [Puccinia graminis f. sp. tritici]
MKLSIIILPLSLSLFQCYNAMQRPVDLDSFKEVNDVGTSGKGGSDVHNQVDPDRQPKDLNEAFTSNAPAEGMVKP